MNRPYKDRPWNELLKARDAFNILEELGFLDGYGPDNNDWVRVEINQEIDMRVHNGKKEGGE
jgi:hypothetical protein